MANISKIAVGGTEYDISGISLIAPIQTTLTATQTYQVNDQFVYNGLLYIATDVISSGTSITIGSNCKLYNSVSDQISETNHQFLDLPTAINNKYIGTVEIVERTGICNILVTVECVSPSSNDLHTGLFLPVPEINEVNIHGWGFSWFDVTKKPLGLYIKKETGELVLRHGEAGQAGYVIEVEYHTAL